MPKPFRAIPMLVVVFPVPRFGGAKRKSNRSLDSKTRGRQELA
jgi:hypothetical protein